MRLSKTQLEDRGICPTCGGTGSRQTHVEVGNDIETEVDFCESCQGTGRVMEDGDVD